MATQIPQNDGTNIGEENSSYTGGAFDGSLGANATDAWYAYRDSNYVNSGWVGKQYSTSKIVAKIRTYTDGVHDYNPKDFTIQGSNNGTDWTTVHTVTNYPQNASTWETITFSNSVGYTYWRINVSANYGNATYLIIPEIEFWEVTTTLLIAVLNQPYNLQALIITSIIEQKYSLAFYLSQIFEQVYGLKLASMLSQPYGDAPVIVRQLLQYYGDAASVRRALVQPYEDALQLRSTLDQPYSYPAALLSIMEQRYSISAVELRAVSEQLYALKTVDLARAVLDQPFALIDGSGQLLSYNIVVVAGDIDLGITHINIEATRDQYCMSCEVHLATQADYVQCKVLDDLTITIDSEVFEFFIEAKQRRRGHATAEYTINGFSKTALLDAPYADTVTEDLSGMASTIVAGLAPDYIINWQTVDWYIPANTLMPADQTPLQIIRQIAAAAGAIIQTEPNGTMTIEPAYPVAVPDWSIATVQHGLSDALDFFSTGETFDHRPGFNRYLISDQLTSDNTLRLEEEAITGNKKYIRAYQTPWQNDFDLRQTGGDWVSVEPLGIDERLVEDEIVEFVSGVGNTSYPIYERVSVEWLRADLGSIVFGEDGKLQSDIEGESLLRISYRTKCRKYLVTDAKTEPVQLVAEEVS